MPRCAVWFADDQLRESATIGGNIVNASPAADGTPPLFAHDAVVELASRRNGKIETRKLPIDEFITGPGKTTLADDEILVAIECDALPGYGGSFEKVGHRRSLVISTGLPRGAGEARCRPAAISRTCGCAIGGIGPVPDRLRDVEQFLMSGPLNASRLEQAAEMPVSLVRSRTRQDYRRDVVRGFMLRGLFNAAQRAGAGPDRADARDGGRLCLSFASKPPSTAARSRATPQPHQRLLDFLRDDLHLTGTKEGCGAGECGACSVFVDGVLMKSCLMPVGKAQGAKIETVEGLAHKGELSLLQKAFHKTGASQCGYCIPGMVMAATAALRVNPFADREEIKERLGGNICRCTGYQKIFDAVELARDVQNGRLPATALAEDEAGGRQVYRRQCPPSRCAEQGVGRAEICRRHDDAAACCICRCCARRIRTRSSNRSILREAEAMEGVEGVITCADVPGEDGFGVFVHDQPVMARGKVRYVGEAVAAVAAEDLVTAKLRAGEDQGGLQAAAGGVRSRSRRCSRARRCCTITRRTTSPSISRSARATSRRASRSPISWSSRITTPRRSSTPISSRKRGSAMSTTTAS